MINPLIAWSLRNRLTVIGLSVLLSVAGAVTTLSTPVDVFPDLTAPTVTVLVEGHGLSPLEMETQVTFPIEAAVNGATDVRRVRSATTVGLSVVWVEFDWGTDVHRARQTITERLAVLGGSLPDQVDEPILAPISSIMGEVLFLAMVSDRHDGMELRRVASTDVRRRLLAVPGVSQVVALGGQTRQYQVVLSTERLRAAGLTAHQVHQAVVESNRNLAGGVLIDGDREVLVEGLGRIEDEADLEAIVVALRDGVPLTVADLGLARVGPALRRGTAAASWRGADGAPITREAVVFAVQKQPNANTLELTDRLDAALADVEAGLPEGMAVQSGLFRQASFIETSIETTLTALLEGAVMVVLVVIGFMLCLRSSLITLSVLPLSLLVAVLVLRALGGGINTMTLGGMAIAIGALVDDAIIDVENVVRRLRENAGRAPADRRPVTAVVFDASVEVRSSIVLATIIVLLVFAPLFVLPGVEGRLLRPLGLAFSASLAASLLTALTLTPALCSLMLQRSRSVARRGQPALVRWLQHAYGPLLDLALRHPLALGVLALALLVGSLQVAAGLGRSFLPDFNEGALTVGLVTMPGTALEESDRLAHRAEVALMAHPEVIAIGRRTGRADEDEHAQGVEASELDLTLDMQRPARLGLPVRDKAALLADLRQDLAAIPGLVATIGQPISHRIDHMLSGTRASIAVKIFGRELGSLRDLAGQVETLLAGIPGVVDLSSEQQMLVPTLRVAFDRRALARHGLTIADGQRALALATMGLPAGQVLEGVNAFELRVLTGVPEQASAERIAGALVPTPGGGLQRLDALAHIGEDLSPNLISREDVQRKIVVMCNAAGRDVGGLVDDIDAAIAREVRLPPGSWIEYGGQFESAETSARRLTWMSGAIIAAIAGLLFAVFRSVRDTALIMVNLPMALVGGVFGTLFTGGVLSVASLIGFITVFGIAARNGIMMVSHIRHLQEQEGVDDFREAVRRGALERLAPILMTALASGLALIPFVLRADEPGSEILSPMAAVILFGLASATFMNMALVPSLYLRFGRPVPAGGAHAEGELR